jgi:DsbC/DsbD-like thiol-disulfide interchange protein
MRGMGILRFLACATAALLLPGAAAASSSAPFRTDGATLRLVTSGLADADGTLRGALEIALDPGWKTYWKEPGASGVPPQIDVSASINVGAAHIHFPAPEWHEDGYGSWAGYGRSLALPVTFSLPAPDRYSLIEADVFLGVCEDVCIPVLTRLTVEPGSTPDDAADAAVVEAAIAALPGSAHDGFGVTAATIEENRLIVTARVPEGGDAALFLAPSPGHGFGRPRITAEEPGTVIFEAPVLARPEGAPIAPADYVLVVGSASVTGSFTVP